MLGRVVARCAVPAPDGDLPFAFPSAQAVSATDLSGLGLTGRRIATIGAVAERVVDGRLRLQPGSDLAAQRAGLLAVPGIGPWTTEYIAMRALGDTDAFPADDLVLRRVVTELRADPQRWRPWRAYAALHLWNRTPEEPT